MWGWFVSFLTEVLSMLANATGDWGIAIIIVTVIVRLLVMPLLTRSSASSARMQALQPLIQEIQDKYEDDPVRLNEELRKFQAEHHFNPLGGCLPMLLQMPVFFALFTVARNVPETASFLNIIPKLSYSVSQAVVAFGVVGALVYIVFDLAFGVLTFVPMVLSSKGMDDAQRQQSLITGAIMGGMMVWFGLQVPAAVLLYYDTSAVWQVVQQQLVTNRVIEKVKAEEAERLSNIPTQVEVTRRERKPRPKKKS